MKTSKSKWILVILRRKSLDRIHIMKVLFLIWYRSREEIKDYFQFEPYLYGPYSLEVYSELRNLQEHGFIIQPPSPIQQWTNYYLTIQGSIEAEKSLKKFNSDTITLIDKTVGEISNLGFFELLQKIYKEAPEYAVNSILKGVVKK